MSSFFINKISKEEKSFIKHGVDLNIRTDSRTCDEHRLILIEQNILESCYGSSHVHSGNTDVIVGIKLEVEEVSNNINNDGNCSESNDGKGKLMVFADISPITSPAFEGKKGEEITCQLESFFSEFLVDYLDLEKLVIVPNKSYFVLHIDIVVFEYSSLATLIDMCSIAIKTALYDVRIPKIKILSADQNEFTVSEDEFDTEHLDASKIPLITSYTKIGSKFVIDVTWEEEQSSSGTISIAFLPPDKIVLMKKIRYGSISTDSMPLLYEKAIKFGCELAKKFNAKMEQNHFKNRNNKSSFSLTFN